jgi:alcohol dehydrogenase
MVEKGEIDTKPWITHRAPFGRAVEEFPKWLQPNSGVLKAMIEL